MVYCHLIPVTNNPTGDILRYIITITKERDMVKKLSKDELAKREKELTKKHGKNKIVAGSIRYGKGRLANKLVVKINTRGIDGKFNGKTRVVATSDLHQTDHTEEDAKILRAERRNERARAKRAAAAAKKKSKKAAK